MNRKAVQKRNSPDPSCGQHASFHTDKQHIERRTLVVVVITIIAMAVEIITGWLTNSMALLADGWHMGTHAAALGISLAAYAFSRKHAGNSRFVFGTWKAEILGAYTSALAMAAAGVGMVWTSIDRLLHPLSIDYSNALIVALAGLGVNLICAFILNSGRPHSHHSHAGHSHGHAHGNNEDLNLKSAYLHVIADAMTSVFAIAALLMARQFGTVWLDPVMGIAGALMIARWSFLLIRDSASILLDHERVSPVSKAIRKAVESDKDSRITDLHAWRVADGRYACIVSVESGKARTSEEYRDRLSDIEGLVHTTIEITARRKS